MGTNRPSKSGLFSTRWRKKDQPADQPAESAPDDDEDHEQHIGRDAEQSQAEQDPRLGLRIVPAGDGDIAPCGSVTVSIVPDVQGGLDTGQNYRLPLHPLSHHGLCHVISRLDNFEN